MTSDRALLVVELATRLGTTPALRAAFAPCVWRARASLVEGVGKDGPGCTPGRSEPCENRTTADGVAANAGARQPDFHFADGQGAAAVASQPNGASEGTGTVEQEMIDRTTAGPRQEPGRAFFEHGVDTVTDLIRPIVGARQVSRRRETVR